MDAGTAVQACGQAGFPHVGQQEQGRFVAEGTRCEAVTKKTWGVAKLTEESRERMEDVLDQYEKPYDPREPVIGLDGQPYQLLDGKNYTVEWFDWQAKRQRTSGRPDKDAAEALGAKLEAEEMQRRRERRTLLPEEWERLRSVTRAERQGRL